MNADSPGLSRASAAFALSAAITVIFNTVIACAKDAYSPLKLYMASLSDHDWTTQGLADVILFVALGFAFLNMRIVSERNNPRRVISFLVAAVIVSGIGLFTWYALY
jgi:hypothetical protein